MKWRIASIFLAALVGAASPLQAEEKAQVVLPSGRSVVLLEVIEDEDGPAGATVRFRFVAPWIADETGGSGPNMAQEEMMQLCEEYALPRLAGRTPPPAQIVISLSERALPFGETDPEVTQYFEAYSVEARKCVWEVF